MYRFDHNCNSDDAFLESSSAARRRYETWIFDLDNTLYPASVNLFHKSIKRCSAFIFYTLNVRYKEAFRLQNITAAYGAILRGLTLHHALDPEAFLNYVQRH